MILCNRRQVQTVLVGLAFGAFSSDARFLHYFSSTYRNVQIELLMMCVKRVPIQIINHVIDQQLCIK